MPASHINLSPQELSSLDMQIYWGIASLVLLVYDWLLCFDQEVRFIWTWRSRGVTISSLVYAASRYALLIQCLLGVTTIYPMSDLSCKANIWVQVAMDALAVVAFSTFSAVRAYALSNRSIWLTTIIILLALPPTAMLIVQRVSLSAVNLPSPLNCSPSGSPSRALSTTAFVITRGSQFAAELLVVGITWWYTYQSYRIRKGVKLGKTVSSLLFYNGSMYFLCLATGYILDIILSTSSLPMEVQEAGLIFDKMIDFVLSIFICRFMLSLRQFDSNVASATSSGLEPQLREHIASTVLEFRAQPSDSLPAFIASFAHPVHVNTVLSEIDSNAVVEDVSEGRENDVGALALEGTSSRRQTSEPSTSQLAVLADSV